MTLPIFQVDAFAEEIFQGNPAAVCLLETELPDETLQSIAQENNLPETAFFRPDDDRPDLRWFTPRQEVPLCGHATLAAGYVALERLRPDADAITFETLSGPLTVSRAGAGFRLDFPAVRSEEVDRIPGDLIDGLGFEPEQLRQTIGDPNYLAILSAESDVRAVQPDLSLLERLHPTGVAVTAPGEDIDFVSRYFAPSYGIPEDPVTGSIHCALAPYWSRRLGIDRMAATQLSKRSGKLGVELRGDRVLLSGAARLYLEGRVSVPGGS